MMWRYWFLKMMILAGFAGITLGQDGERPECLMWSKLENKTLPLQNQGHANCSTNSECTGFNCKGLYQEKELNFGMRVLPCEETPGVEIFGHAPQFGANNFSHIFTHEDQFEIPGSMLNASVLQEMVIQLKGVGQDLKGKLEVHLRMDHEKRVLIMGLTLKACLQQNCIVSFPIFNQTEIPVPECPIKRNQTKLLIKTNSICSISDASACGDDQLCVQDDSSSQIGICQCKPEFSDENGVCVAANAGRDQLQHPLAGASSNEDSMLGKELQRLGDEDIKDRLKKSLSSPSTQEGISEPSGGAIAAAVISVIVIVALFVGASFYVVLRTRLLPRLRARMTNTPYEDIIITDRNNVNTSSQSAQSRLA